MPAMLSCLVLLFAQIALANPPRDVRDVDWLNRTYSTDWTDGPSRHVNGLWEGGARGMSRVRVTFGDVTGDGRDEAVLLFLGNGGGSGYFSWIEVRTADDAIVGSVPGGDRAHGGIHDVRVVDGAIALRRMSAGPGGGACCPAYSLDETWSWDGAEFQRAPTDGMLAIGKGKPTVRPTSRAPLAQVGHHLRHGQEVSPRR